MSIRCFFGWHNPQWVVSHESPCTQVQQCTRCGEIFTEKTIHTFDAWEYTEQGECSHKRTCTVCGSTQERHNIHTPGQWTRIDESNQTSQCLRCGVVLTLHHHTWDEWTNTDGGHSRSCLYCDESETEPHDWIDQGIVGEVYRSGTAWDVNGWECEKCGAITDNAYGPPNFS